MSVWYVSVYRGYIVVFYVELREFAGSGGKESAVHLDVCILLFALCVPTLYTIWICVSYLYGKSYLLCTLYTI